MGASVGPVNTGVRTWQVATLQLPRPQTKPLPLTPGQLLGEAGQRVAFSGGGPLADFLAQN